LIVLADAQNLVLHKTSFLRQTCLTSEKCVRCTNADLIWIWSSLTGKQKWRNVLTSCV